MTNKDEYTINILSAEYKETYLKAQEINDKLNQLKEIMTKLAGNNDYENNIVKIKHYKSKSTNYKQFIEDEQLTIPNKYISERESVRISYVKPKETQSKYI